MNPDYVMVGGITLDWVITAAGEVAFKRCGGNAFYSAIGAHVWNDQIAVVSRVGSDFPDAYLDSFADAGVDIRGIHRVDERHELVVAFRYDPAGRRSDFNPVEEFAAHGVTNPDAVEDHILFHESWTTFGGADLFDPLVEEVPLDCWHAEGFHLAGMRASAQSAFITALSSRAKLFTLDPVGQGWTGDETNELFKHVPLLLPSEAEVAALIAEPEPARALARLAALGPRVVAIKLGPLGSLVYDGRTGESRHVPIYPARVKDTTGAGDAYCGGFLVGYAETGDAFEAALRGTVSSSFVIEEFDSRYGLSVGRKEAEARLRELRATATAHA